MFGVSVAKLAEVESKQDQDMSGDQLLEEVKTVLANLKKKEIAEKTLVQVKFVECIALTNLTYKCICCILRIIFINESFLSVACQWNSFGKWSACSQNCGGGWQRRSRTVKQKAAFGGKQCDGCAAETRACNTHNCPRMLPLNQI